MNDARKKFEEIFEREDFVEFYLKSSKESIVEFFGEEMSKVPEFKQNNIHHQYDLFEHILRTVERIPKENLTPENLKKVRIAAFFHDIGKPEVVQEKDGKDTYYGHAKKSTEMSDSILNNLGYTKAEIDEIKFLIEHHDDFISLQNIDEINSEKIAKILTNIRNNALKTNGYNPTISDYRNLLQLCKADAMAQRDIVEKDGNVIDTKESRISRIGKIEEVLPEAIVLDVQKEKEKLQKKYQEMINGPTAIKDGERVLNSKQIENWNNMTEEAKKISAEEIKKQIENTNIEIKRLLETNENEKTMDD